MNEYECHDKTPERLNLRPFIRKNGMCVTFAQTELGPGE